MVPLKVDSETVAADTVSVMDEALARLEEHAQQVTDGRWLEDLTEDVAPHVREWNVDGCWRWEDWPDRDRVMPEGTPAVDVGIDLVARRRDDRGWIAIQVKARRLDSRGEGNRVTSSEMNKFLAAAANSDVWQERWVVVNGAVPLGGHSPGKVRMSGAPVKVVNVAQAVESERAVVASDSEHDLCPHCETGLAGEGRPIQTRSCMQREAVQTAVERLRANQQANEDNIPRGEARGRIVLPCGTGKTRIALRITEKLTYPGELSVVLCPSIALVAQIRREFLWHTKVPMRMLAVCSDQGVAVDDESVANSDDATLDRGLATTEEIKGCPVTTDPELIAEWIRQRRDGPAKGSVSVIFGTYQSASRVAEGVKLADAADGFKVLVCDEAHRTAGVRRRRRPAGSEERLREFTLCHDRDAFPASYRVYQTATPSIYGDNPAIQTVHRKPEFVVRDMDAQETFGVELFRRSYIDAVRNGWLSDYRIIAMAVGGQEATSIANALVKEADEQAALDAETGSRSVRVATKLPSTGDYLKGMAFALVMGGGALAPDGDRVPLRSCIGFLNTIARSKTMTTVLQSDPVRKWVAKQVGEPAPTYTLEHLDASSPVAKRDEAKHRLAMAVDDKPHSVLNVGIFGEGTDSPSLSAVAFLEPRKSPIDVVQAVGRAMRRAAGKTIGYIVVPVVIPPGVDAEHHLAVSDKHEGWRELGDILQALRAHDKRIEDALPERLTIQLPLDESPPPDLVLRTAVAVGRPDRTRLEYAVVTSSSIDDAEDIARAAVAEGRPLLDYPDTEPFNEGLWADSGDEPTSLIVHAQRPDGTTVTRADTGARRRTTRTGPPGRVNPTGTKRRARQVAQGERGRPLPDPEERKRRREERERIREERRAAKLAAFEAHVQGVLVDLSERMGNGIAMNLLTKSGLTGNKVQRDLNLLDAAVTEAARYLHDEGALAAALDTYFALDNLSAPKQGKPRADGSTIAALLWMNAAMLHQRVHTGGWLGRRGIYSLADIKASTEPEEGFRDSWDAITRQDFLPVIEPASLALSTARRTGRLGGLRRALRHIAAEAEQIAETYADMGADHAGALFNKVMGDQSSDGAFFTRPVAADITARLALDAIDPKNMLDWTDPDVWRDHKTVDLACGSGTLLTAMLTEMKRRAAARGAGREHLAHLQKVAVEETLKGLDINPVSLQLAATQLMAGNTDVKYRRMGLHLMPYGPQPDGSVAAGTPELFGRQDIVNAGRLFDDAATSTSIKTGAEPDRGLVGPEMDDAAEAARDARIIIMNPPFTNRSKMGQKFPKPVQQALRRRMDTLEGFLSSADPHLSKFLDKNSLEPRFAALASLCLNRDKGVFATVLPTTALTAPSSLPKRLELAKRFHIHTILTCHQPGNINLSQNTNINESIVVLRRHAFDPPPPTRIVSLDRLPADEAETDQLFDSLSGREEGLLPGWGEISQWPAERIRAGDWTAAVWRSPELASATARFAEHKALTPLSSSGLAQRERERESKVHKTGPTLSVGYRRATV